MTVKVTVYAAQAAAEAIRESLPERVVVANAIVSEARADAPVRTGEYRDGIKVRQDGDRVFAVDDDPEAIYKEYGTSDTPAHASLTEAAMKHGKYSGWQPRG